MTNTKLASKLLKMKEQIEEANVEKNREEGKLDEHFKQLKKEFRCKNEKEMNGMIDEGEREIDKEQKALEKGVRRLEDNYEW